MGLVAVTETAQMFRQKNIVLTERDKEFVVQFAFRTNDRELTNKLIDELAEAGADRDAVCRKYQTLTHGVCAGLDTEDRKPARIA